MIILFGGGILFLGAALGLQHLAAERYGFTSGAVDETYTFDPLNYLYINCTNLDVEIKRGDSDKIIVEYLNEAPLIIEQTDSVIRLTQNDEFKLSFLTADMFSYKMTVYLPQKQYKFLYIATVSGNINISGTASDSLSLSTKDGEISLSDIDSELDIKAVSSDIKCVFSTLNAPVHIENTSGTSELILPEEAELCLKYSAKKGALFSELLAADYTDFDGELILNTAGTQPVMCEYITENGKLNIDKTKE